MTKEVNVQTARGEVKLFNPTPRVNDPTRYAKAKRQVGLRCMSHDVEMHFFHILSEIDGFEDMWDHIYADTAWSKKYVFVDVKEGK